MSDTPARHLNLAGASNFRDLGGYPARDGRTVRWRQIFRSNHLGHLTGDDIEVVRGLGVRSAFDFRGSIERAEARCAMAEITVHSLPVEPTVVAALRAIAASGTPLSTVHAAEVMRDSYRNYVQQNTPPAEVISEDYLLTNHFYRRDPSSGSDLPDDVKQVLGSVQTSFLGAAFEAIDADYGDLESYLRDGLGLGTAERAKLEARYLDA